MSKQPTPTEITNESGLTFDEWYRKADHAVDRICGLGVDDLPDGNSYDAFISNESPASYVRMILEEEGFPFNEDH